MAGLRRSLRSQQGQVLVLGMLLAAALGLAWMRYFATGQVLAAKVRLVHGLDAAAYSGALVQARTLNFLAYLNRARMAHQLHRGIIDIHVAEVHIGIIARHLDHHIAPQLRSFEHIGLVD